MSLGGDRKIPIFAVFLAKNSLIMVSFCLFIYLFYLNKYIYCLFGNEMARKCEKFYLLFTLFGLGLLREKGRIYEEGCFVERRLALRGGRDDRG